MTAKARQGWVLRQNFVAYLRVMAKLCSVVWSHGKKNVACFGVTAEGRHLASIHHVPLKKNHRPQTFAVTPSISLIGYGYSGDKSVFAAGSGKTAACSHNN